MSINHALKIYFVESCGRVICEVRKCKQPCVTFRLKQGDKQRGFSSVFKTHKKRDEVKMKTGPILLTDAGGKKK